MTRAKTKKEPPNSELSFEQALARLEEIVSTLEAGEEHLESAIGLFEEGAKLSRVCQERLNTAQAKIEKLVAATDGKITAEALELED